MAAQLNASQEFKSKAPKKVKPQQQCSYKSDAHPLTGMTGGMFLFLHFIACSHMQKPAIEANDTYGFSYFRLGLHNFVMAIKIILRFACLSCNCSTSCKFIGRYLLRYTNRIKHRGNIAARLCQHAVTNEPYTQRGCTINIVTYTGFGYIAADLVGINDCALLPTCVHVWFDSISSHLYSDLFHFHLSSQ